MRGVAMSLFALGLSSALATAVVGGCAADGTGALDVPVDPTATPDEDSGAYLPPVNPADSDVPDAPKDAKKDGAKPDAGVDAGPPPPEPGTACPTPNAIFTKKCGACGDAQAVCLDEGSSSKWSPYGVCTGELVNGCLPGTTQACGNCGTQTCTQYCGWGSCMGQPVGGCLAGVVDLSAAGCPVAATYRVRTCKADCSWNSFSLTCDSAPTSVDIAPAVGGVASSFITLGADLVLPRLSGTCPMFASVTTLVTPYNYFEVRNPTAKTATVSIYHTQAPGGGVPKTTLASYDGASIPADDTQRKACVKGVSTFGVTALTGNSNLASLTASTAVTIAPGASVLVYSAQYYELDASNPQKAGGTVRINVKTDLLSN